MLYYKVAVLLAAFTTLGAADSILATYTLTNSDTCAPMGGVCPALAFDIPQTTVPLSSVLLSFVDSQTVHWGFNDSGIPYGTPLTETNRTSIAAQNLASDGTQMEFPTFYASFTEVLNTTSKQGGNRICGSVCGPLEYTTDLASSFTSTDVAIFEGTGFYTLNLEPIGAGGTTLIEDHVTLTVSYIDPPTDTVPEPRFAFVLALIPLAIIGLPIWALWGSGTEMRNKIKMRVLPRDVNQPSSAKTSSAHG